MGNFDWHVSELDRMSKAKGCLSPRSRFFGNLINSLLNIFVAFGVLYLLDFNLFSGLNAVVFCSAFIAFDFIMGFVDTYIVVVRPARRAKQLEDVLTLQRYVEWLEKKVESCKSRAKDFQKIHCKDCYYMEHYWGDNNYDPSLCRKSSVNRLTHWPLLNYEYYFKLWRKYKTELEHKLADIEKKEIKENDKVSSDFKNKLEYFDTVEKRFKLYVSENGRKELKPIIKGISELIALLNEKPIGLSFVPNSLYIYIDELQRIINTLNTLDKEKNARYSDMVVKITTALKENLDEINKRIDNYEVEDLEVSLNVLYSELVKEEEENV